jgi:hypothetical protein
MEFLFLKDNADKCIQSEMKKSIARPTGKLQTAEVSVKKHDGSKST